MSQIIICIVIVIRHKDYFVSSVQNLTIKDFKDCETLDSFFITNKIRLSIFNNCNLKELIVQVNNT